MEIVEAKDVVTKNDLAVVLFTRGTHLIFDDAGNGQSGNWAVDTDVLDEVDKVIIYLRDDEAGTNRVLLGNYAGHRPSPEANRHIIRFTRLQEVGTTDSNWNEFAGSGQNPVSYVGDFY